MSKKASKVDKLDPQVESAGIALKKAYAMLLESGHSPSAIVGASLLASINLMEVQNMSRMDITNRFYEFFDGLRDQAFGGKK